MPSQFLWLLLRTCWLFWTVKWPIYFLHFLHHWCWYHECLWLSVVYLNSISLWGSWRWLLYQSFITSQSLCVRVPWASSDGCSAEFKLLSGFHSHLYSGRIWFQNPSGCCQNLFPYYTIHGKTSKRETKSLLRESKRERLGFLYRQFTTWLCLFKARRSESLSLEKALFLFKGVLLD